MNQRQAKFWVWWLLPFLATRALVPAGFMTDVASGTFKLVMCSEVIKLPAALNGNTPADQVPSSSPDHSRSNSSTHALCSFAGSATAMLSPCNAVFTFQGEYRAVNVITTAASIVDRANTAHSIRGPPAFS